MKLKICGMKYQENLIEVATLQPDYLGFILYEKSSRFFNGSIPELPDSIKKVGVFVDASSEEILDKIKQYHLQVIQLHGEESPEFCFKLKQATSGQNVEIIKVFSLEGDFNFKLLKPYETVCDYYLFDTKGKLPGGNGFKFDWEILKNYPNTKPYFLSGGIGLEDIENIKEFLVMPASQYCYAIDVNSQFELEPGLKDVEKLKSFVTELNSLQTNIKLS